MIVPLNRDMRLRADLALVGITIVWGTTFVVVKDALAHISIFVFLALRFSVAAVALAPIYRKGFRRTAVLPGLLAGGLLFTAYVFQTLGLELTTPSKSAFLTGLSIPMVPLASSLVYRNKPRSWEVVGIVAASLGMVLMTLGSSAPANFPRMEISRGDLLSFLCAVTFALHIVVIGHFSQAIGFESVAVTQIAVAAACGLVLCWFAEPMRLDLTSATVGAILATGLLATALAFTTQAWAQQYTSATRAALIFSLEPVVAWVTSWAVTGETMPNRGKVGAGLILASILLVEGTRKRRGSETNGAEMTS
jgi:drug/metabolite transporter (DMT)-like permease